MVTTEKNQAETLNRTSLCLAQDVSFFTGRTLREAKAFTQESSVGISPRYYGAIERGERNVAIRNLIKIAFILEVEIGELFPSLKNLIKAVKLH